MQSTATTTPTGDPFTLVMNTQRQALSTYTNYRFNSFAKFNDVYIGASANGLFALTGPTDAGTNIAAVARTGTTDFGDSRFKRVTDAYVGYRTNGELVLRCVTDEDTANEYTIDSISKVGIHTVRVSIGKGLRARYWQFEIRNVAGADFELDTLEAKPALLSRRITSA